MHNITSNAIREAVRANSSGVDAPYPNGITGSATGQVQPILGPYPYLNWQNHAITDKTAKAIQVLTMLQKEHGLDLGSVDYFIGLVAKISAIL